MVLELGFVLAYRDFPKFLALETHKWRYEEAVSCENRNREDIRTCSGQNDRTLVLPTQAGRTKRQVQTE